MIAKLKGIVDEVGDDWVVIDVSGVGYLVFASSRTLSRLAAGEAVSLAIETHVREDHIHLYGFVDTAERAWFRLLTTVQGVGAKVGLGILGIMDTSEIGRAIAAQDKAAFGRAQGVGPKLAGRIVSELKDKAGAMTLGLAATAQPKTGAGPAPTDVTDTAVADAVSALVNLGYNPSQALGAVAEEASVLGDGADVAPLIKGALSRLAPASEPTQVGR